MRKYLTPLFATATFLWMSAGAYFLNKQYREQSTETTTIINTDILLKQVVLYFPKGQTTPITNARYLPYLKSLSDSLQCGSSQSLMIRCYYDDTESDNAKNSDLGLIRADSIKNILVSMGASSDLIETESVKVTDSKIIKSSQFYSSDLTLVNNNLGLFPSANWYYSKNQIDFVHSAKIKEYISCLKRFLKSTSVNYKVYVTNIATKEEKKNISDNRLRNIERYLNEEGLTSERFIFQTRYVDVSQKPTAFNDPYIVINLATP